MSALIFEHQKKKAGTNKEKKPKPFSM